MSSREESTWRRGTGRGAGWGAGHTILYSSKTLEVAVAVREFCVKLKRVLARARGGDKFWENLVPKHV